MSIELKIPEVGESITEVEIGSWLKQEGQEVKKDEPVVTLESEKATVELPAPESGIVTRVLKKQGEVAKVGEVIAYLDTDGQAAATAPTDLKQKKPGPHPAEEKKPSPEPVQETKASPAPAEPAARPKPKAEQETPRKESEPKTQPSAPPSPADNAIEPELTRVAGTSDGREEEVVPMSRLRRTVAERLVEAKNSAALLTTFNEIDMTDVMELRKRYGDAFQRKYNVKLGFMSFFAKAAIDALKQFPVLNAQVDGTNIVYHNFYDIGVAIGSAKGLVVPVLRNAERMSFAEIEVAIGDFARRAGENKLKVDELQGGTFTISNGGVYGSLLSTPIVNPPQSGVLGMHAIQDRPVARDGNIVIRPMMYVALSYDHRIVDGREAVAFLKRVKEAIESPSRMLLEI